MCYYNSRSYISFPKPKGSLRHSFVTEYDRRHLLGFADMLLWSTYTCSKQPTCSLIGELQIKLLQLKPKIRTRMDPSYLAAQLKELYKNKSEADVTVKCQGETLKAHSFLLAMRFVVLLM